MSAIDSNFENRKEILKELYMALNRNDIDSIVNQLDSQIVRTEFDDSPAGGTYRGLAEVKAHFIKGRATWADGGCYPEKFIASADKIVALVHVKVKLKQNQQWVEGHTADVFTFHHDKIVHMHTFSDEKKAFESIGSR